MKERTDRITPANQEAARDPSAKTRTRSRRFFSVLFVLAVIVGAGAFAWSIVLPDYVETRIRRGMESRGLAPTSLNVTSMTLTELVIRDLRIGDKDGPRAEKVVVTFDPKGLAAGHVKNVVITGFHAQVHNDGTISGFDLESGDARESEGGDADPTRALFEQVTGPLAFDRLSIENASIVVFVDADSAWTLTAAGTVDSLENGEKKVQLSVTAPDRTLEITGGLVPSEEGFEATLSVRGPKEPSGALSLDLAASSADSRSLSWTLAADWDRPSVQLGAHGFVAGSLTVRARGTWDADQALRSEGTLILASVADADGNLPSFDPGVSLLAGEIAWDGTLPPTPAAALSLTLKDGAVRAADDAWRVEGALASVLLHSLSPPTVPSGQELSWQSFHYGDLETAEGRLLFAFEGPQTLSVEEIHIRTMDGGSLAASPFRTSLDALSIHADLTVRDLALESWLRLVTLDHVQGTGRIEGRLRLDIESKPRLDIQLGESQLRAAGGGILALKDIDMAKRVLDEIPAQTVDGGTAYDKIVQQRIVDALKDFAFSHLTFLLHPGDEGIIMTVATKGKGRQVPQELDLTLNFTGINDLLDVLLDVQFGIQQAKARVTKKLSEK